MNTQEDILQNVGETIEFANQYLQREIALLKLDGAEKVAKSTSAIITLGVIGFLVGMVFIMLSLAIGFWLGDIMNSYAQAFFVITAVYAFLAFIVYFFRKTLVADPVLAIILKIFYK